MFFLYLLWYTFFEMTFFFKNFINYVYIKYNRPNLINTRNFSDLSYFEKLFLVFFYKNNEFDVSISNLNDKNKILSFRKYNYPLINHFHIFKNTIIFKWLPLSITVKQFNFFKNFNFVAVKKNTYLCKNLKNDFLFFILLQKIIFEKYFNSFNSTFFKNGYFVNVLLTNFFYFFFFMNSQNRLIYFDLNKYNQWFQYCYNVKLKKLINNPNRTALDLELEDLAHQITLIKLILLVRKYKKLFKKFKFSNFFFFFNPSNLNSAKIKIRENWNLNFVYKIRFKETSVSKYIDLDNFPSYSIMYLRKNRVFNKSRYSRNRQLYRTGVYWCIWLNIVLVYGLYFVFYRFSFNFGYIWWGLFVLLFSTIFSRVTKYNYFNIYFVVDEFNMLTRWIGLLFSNFLSHYFSILFYLFKGLNADFLFKKNYNFNILKPKFLTFFFKNSKKRESIKILEFWHGLKEKDTSFLKYKTVNHWIKLFFKLLIT